MSHVWETHLCQTRCPEPGAPLAPGSPLQVNTCLCPLGARASTPSCPGDSQGPITETDLVAATTHSELPGLIKQARGTRESVGEGRPGAPRGGGVRRGASGAVQGGFSSSPGPPCAPRLLCPSCPPPPPRCYAQSLSRVQPCDPMDCSPPGCSVRADSPGKNTGVCVSQRPRLHPRASLLVSAPSLPEVGVLASFLPVLLLPKLDPGC